jgi:acyl carrier protein
LEVAVQQKDVVSKIRELIGETMMVDDSTLSSISDDHPDFMTSIGGNSIDALELMIASEEKFGIEFEDSEMNAELVQTIGSFSKKIFEKLSGGSGQPA